MLKTTDSEGFESCHAKSDRCCHVPARVHMYTVKLSCRELILPITTKAYEMKRCLLTDLPAGALQAVLKNLNPADYASLREVSRSVCEHITAHIPYISLVLTDNRDLLQQWHQATCSLRHVGSIHIHVVCDITEQVFDEAMQLLSERTSVKELHVLAVPEAVAHKVVGTASVHTLLPLKHILPSLQILVIKGVAVYDLLDDLTQLAAAAAAVTAQGWKLQSLTCHVYCYVIRQVLIRSSGQVSYHWSEACRSITQLPITFPFLQQLSWEFDSVKYHLRDLRHPSSATGHSAGGGQQQASVLVTEELAQCALVTAVANAVLQLNCLEVLTTFRLPDVWKAHPAASATAATAASAVAAALDALLDQSDLPQLVLPAAAATAAAAAVFTTLDDYGCWLLHQHPKLRQLHIKVEDWPWVKFGMCWQRQQQQPCVCTSSSCEPGNCCKVAELVDLDMGRCKQIIQDVDAATGLPIASTLELNNRRDRSRHLEFTQWWSQYTNRPASSLLNHISSCHLVVHNHHNGVPANLLSGMKSLKHLELEMIYHTQSGCNRNRRQHVSTATLAAAAVPGLQSLSLGIYRALREGPEVHLTGDLLLPLTAAAGGPGSSLTKLELHENFASASKAVGVASWVSVCAWHRALLQFDGLRELVISADFEDLLDFPVECLPGGLEVLDGSRLRITMRAAAAANGIRGSSCNACRKLLSCNVQATHGTAVMCPHLHTLKLSDSHLISPSILASNQLHKLSVHDCSWTGGWAAAATAWPNVNHLVWLRSGLDSYSSNSSIAVSCRRAETMTSWESRKLIRLNLATTLWDVFDVFGRLKSFHLDNHPVDRQFPDRCAAAVQQIQLSGRAYVWHSSANYSLLVRCSLLGTMRSSSRPPQEQILKQQHLKSQALAAADATNRGAAQHILSQLTAAGPKACLLTVMTVAVLFVLECIWRG